LWNILTCERSTAPIKHFGLQLFEWHYTVNLNLRFVDVDAAMVTRYQRAELLSLRHHNNNVRLSRDVRKILFAFYLWLPLNARITIQQQSIDPAASVVQPLQPSATVLFHLTLLHGPSCRCHNVVSTNTASPAMTVHLGCCVAVALAVADSLTQTARVGSSAVHNQQLNLMERPSRLTLESVNSSLVRSRLCRNLRLLRCMSSTPAQSPNLTPLNS